MANAVTITVQGTDRTNVIPFQGDKGKVDITYTMPGIATATVVLFDPTNSITIADNATVLITDPTTPTNNAFQGYVQKRKAVLVANYRWWELSCVDLNSWLDRKVVGAPDGTQFYEDPPATFTAFDPNAVSQATDAATVQWLFTKYAPDLPVDTTTYVQTMTTIPAGTLRWHTVTLRSALDDLARYTGSFVRYWIDADWKFHWTNTVSSALVAGQANGPLTLLMPIGNSLPAAPAQLTDGAADHTTTFNYENLSVEWDDTGWLDALYVEGGTTYTLIEYQMVTYNGGGLYNPATQVDGVYSTNTTAVPIGTQMQCLRYPQMMNGVNRYYVYSSNAPTNLKGYYIDVSKVTLGSVLANPVTGGSGWVNNATPTAREGILRDTRSLTQSTRDSLGNSTLTQTGKSVIRGSCDVNLSQGGWFPGQAIGLTNAVLGLSNAQYVIQKVTTKFLSGAGYRTLSIDWGDAPQGTIGLRRNAQQSVLAQTGGGGSPARRPAAKMQVTVSNAAPAASGYSRVIAQAVDWAGNPWPIHGAPVTWSVQVFDASGNDVTLNGGFTFTAGTTTTDVNGSAWGDLQVSATNNLTYFVTATLNF